jgi:hypothetical protein
MPTSFMRSTIDFFQSSFSEFLEAISLSTALTSTLAGAGAPPEDAAGIVEAEPAGGMEEEAGAPAPGVEGPEDEAGVGAFPKIFDIKVLNNFISRKLR